MYITRGYLDKFRYAMRALSLHTEFEFQAIVPNAFMAWINFSTSTEKPFKARHVHLKTKAFSYRRRRGLMTATWSRIWQSYKNMSHRVMNGHSPYENQLIPECDLPFERGRKLPSEWRPWRIVDMSELYTEWEAAHPGPRFLSWHRVKDLNGDIDWIGILIGARLKVWTKR